MEKIPPFPSVTTDQTFLGFFPNPFADVTTTISSIGTWLTGDHQPGSNAEYGAIAAVTIRSAFFLIGLIIVLGAMYNLLRPALARAVETVAPIAAQAAPLVLGA